MRGKAIFFAFVLILITNGCMGSELTPSSTKAINTPPSFPQTPPEINPADAKFLFEIKCSLCHTLDRPASRKMDYNEWLETIYRMKENGAPIDDQEARIIAAYLSEEYGNQL